MMPTDLEAVFWDFDGVILDSNRIRDKGFSQVLDNYAKKDVEKLLTFHRKNGGLSRYVKFRYFFEEVRGERVSEEQIQILAQQFSKIMKENLLSENLLILETTQLISRIYEKIPMYIVSGSDQTELRYLCEQHKINHFFKRIHGSPKPKKDWVKQIIREEQLDHLKCALVGDSLNDYEAACVNNVYFTPYNLCEEYYKFLRKSKCIKFENFQKGLISTL